MLLERLQRNHLGTTDLPQPLTQCPWWLWGKCTQEHGENATPQPTSPKTALNSPVSPSKTHTQSIPFRKYTSIRIMGDLRSNVSLDFFPFFEAAGALVYMIL